MRVCYALSDRFDYNLLISHDAGPAFAAGYGWPTISIRNIPSGNADLYILDPRIASDELPVLARVMAESSAVFVIRLVDPYVEQCQDHWWYRFASECLDKPRIHYMLAYHPSEVTAWLFTRARRSRFLFAPYVYDSCMELVIDHETRKHELLFSGAQNPSIYPLRNEMRRARLLWPPLRAMSAQLLHPGYPDIGQHRKHEVVGKTYVEKLSKFCFATVCSSRCRLEFLKYREFAYAGVVPVGDMPATLLDAPPDSWIPWRRNFVALTSQLRGTAETADRATRFREFMRAKRDMSEMRERVSEQLACLA